MQRRIFLLLISVFLAIFLANFALATWQLFVEPSISHTTIYGYADSDDCVVITSGRVYEITYMHGGDINVLKDISDYFCIPANTVFVMTLKGYPVVASFPTSKVRASDAFPFIISDAEVGPRTVLRVGIDTTVIVLLAVVLTIIGIIAANIFIFIRSKEPKAEKTEQSILDYVAKNPGCSQKDICRATGLEKYQVSRILSRLEAEGKIIRIKRGITNRVFLPQQLQ